MLMHIVQDYRERARGHQRGHEEAEARCQASEAERQALQVRVGAVEDEVRALTAELEEEKGAHTLARSEVRATEARLAEAELALAIREQEVGNARLKTLELEREVKNLKRKAAYHEAREQAQDAVRLFCESEEFRDLLEEEGVNELIQGFKDFRNQLRRLLPDFDLNLLRPGAGVERSEAEAETPEADQGGLAEAAEAVPEVTETASEAVPGAAEAAEEEALIAEPAIPEVAEPEP
ncbi:tropomyosin beta chain-like [Phoenix dactylifera]|uniref:Tropomyosin beta chain-like n=1 Tax=Phoenix dactylifera TaxID=42345 RepID=A0A8B8ZTL6_PHODC|nr:tropomyosin beta chain-like [Phoenix dactylifera]